MFFRRVVGEMSLKRQALNGDLSEWEGGCVDILWKEHPGRRTGRCRGPKVATQMSLCWKLMASG